MNQQVEKLVEWVANEIWCLAYPNRTLRQMQKSVRDQYRKTANKILSHPDLALIDREKEMQDVVRDYFSLSGKEFLAKYPDVEEEAYWDGEGGEGLMQAIEKFKAVIPLVQELKEE